MTDNHCSSPYTCEECPHEDTDQCDRRPERPAWQEALLHTFLGGDIRRGESRR